MLRSKIDDLSDYLRFCIENGFSSANLMELYAYPDENWTIEERNFFTSQYVPYKETFETLIGLGVIDEHRHRYGHSVRLNNGFTVLATDSTYTIRDFECKNVKCFVNKESLQLELQQMVRLQCALILMESYTL